MKSEQIPQRAVIYCRVSDVKQTVNGDGLSSQRTRCEEFAKHRNLSVDRVFFDDISGKTADRPGMRDLLVFLNNAAGTKYAVLIDDLSRLARDVEAYRLLRRAISEAGGVLMSPSIKFGEDSDSTLIENLLASVAQHQRQKNGEQTKNRMWARAKNGYWVFYPMPGYVYKKVAGHNKMLVIDEPVASVVRELLTGTASGRFEAIKEAKEFLDNHPLFPKGKSGHIPFDRVKRILTNPIYAGFIDVPDWGIHMVPGKHEPIIDSRTHTRILERLERRAKAPKRVDIREDFPMRGFVACDACGEPYTSCWSAGSHKRYPYYLCDTKGCSEYRKSIRKEVIEGDFEEILTTITPRPEMIKLAKAMFQDMWDQVHGAKLSSTNEMKTQLKKLDKQSDALMDRILDADGSLVRTYENRLKNLEREKAKLSARIAESAQPATSFERVYRTVFDFLSNPRQLWCSSHYEERRNVLRMAFGTHLRFVRNQGYRTPQTALPFRALGVFCAGELEMVPLA